METGMGIALFSVWLWIAIISVYSQFGFWAIVIDSEGTAYFAAAESFKGVE